MGAVIRYYLYTEILGRGVDGIVNREGKRSMKEEHSDDDLIERIRTGDEKAAEELIKRYYTSILYYCKRQCFNLERAEDLTQETFLKLFKNLSGIKGKENLRHIYLR